MHDFRCTSSIDMFYDVLKSGMHHYKETEGGRATVCKAIELYGVSAPSPAGGLQKHSLTLWNGKKIHATVSAGNMSVPGRIKCCYFSWMSLR